MAVKILAVAGSLRLGSYNRKLLALAVAAAKKLGADVDVADLKSQNLPVYDGDLEGSAYPEGAADLKARANRAEAILIASPEYNNSIPGGLKNAIDWISRPPASNPFKGKPVLLMGATMGGFGTLHAQTHLRQVFTYFGAWLLADSVKLSRAQDAFEADGSLKDPKTQQLLEAAVAQLVKTAELFATAK